MNHRTLGNTGWQVSEVGFGCIPIIRLPQDQATQVLLHAFEKGVNFFDTANMYRDSEEKLGIAFAARRRQIFLATKTTCRDGGGARAHLENSLRKLQTDYIDLYQFHQVSQEKDWDAILAPGGAMDTVRRAQEEGKIRQIGITSHSLPMAIKLAQTGLFATIMFPFNFIEDSALAELLPLSESMSMGFLAMKPFAGGAIDNAALAFRFIRQHPGAYAIPGFDSIESVDEILSFYDQPPALTPEDQAAMDGYRRELGQKFCRRCEYCQPCPSGVLITPAMGYPILAKRMSPAVAASFAKGPMESIGQCTQCGACITRCPYTLPIPEILSHNQALYEEHCRENPRG